MIEVWNLTKEYGKRRVLDDITVAFQPGAVYGLTGPNGCGKTTFMRCICGFTRSTSGFVKVMDKKVGQDCDFAPSTGVILETPGFLNHYSGRKNLKLLSDISHGADELRIDEVLRMAGLDPRDAKPVGQYSLGMRQRLGIAQVLMENPAVLILDEPFNGLDQEGQREVHKLLWQQKREGKTILLSSHHQADIAEACDEIFQMNDGKLIS